MECRLWNVQCSQIVSFLGPIDKICSVVIGDFLEKQECMGKPHIFEKKFMSLILT